MQHFPLKTVRITYDPAEQNNLAYSLYYAGRYWIENFFKWNRHFRFRKPEAI